MGKKSQFKSIEEDKIFKSIDDGRDEIFSVLKIIKF